MDVTDRIAKTFHMDDEAWRRHANPWSVWTRFAAVPALLVAIWSRTWIGWWSLLPIGVVVAWLFVNPRAFPPVEHPESWASRGIYGERVWLRDRDRVPPDHRAVLRLLVLLGLVAFGLIVWGLVALRVWPTVFGATVLILAQLWRIDRFTRLWENARPGAAGGAGAATR
ncbi:DUF6653 family protein [Saccharothrix coeruleofusca]|uniref:Uncharacterized protein n=1 Tax=Saccharothrix coeruleofusca TaxID=33919 RepID=A0A918EFK4_9PSEU|nr:DUF6653 family protein [Saccharothrix coeruleofusca]GGP73984.1 hypothetical protein GCM10010185_54370 [Saccharothrix coeruleofusca]